MCAVAAVLWQLAVIVAGPTSDVDVLVFVPSERSVIQIRDVELRQHSAVQRAGVGQYKLLGIFICLDGLGRRGRAVAGVAFLAFFLDLFFELSRSVLV